MSWLGAAVPREPVPRATGSRSMCPCERAIATGSTLARTAVRLHSVRICNALHAHWLARRDTKAHHVRGTVLALTPLHPVPEALALPRLSNRGRNSQQAR